MDFHSKMLELSIQLRAMPKTDTDRRYGIACEMTALMASAPEMPLSDREYYFGIIESNSFPITLELPNHYGTTN